MKKTRIDFNIIRDGFSSYGVENGQTLKIFTPLVEIFNQTDDENQGQIITKSTSHVITPNDVNLYDIEYEQGDPTEKDQIRELKFHVERKVTSIYETKKLLIMIDIKVKKIFLTNKTNDQNEPLLRYLQQTSITVIKKQSLFHESISMQKDVSSIMELARN